MKSYESFIGKRVNEKLKIQPVSKERLYDATSVPHYRTAEEMKANFKTGDIVIFGIGESIGVFLSFDDLNAKDRYYLHSLDLKSASYNDAKEGLFISYIKIEDTVFRRWTDMYTYEYVQDYKPFNGDLVREKGLSVVNSVYRIPDLKLPLDVKYFQEPPFDKAKPIWKTLKWLRH